MAIDLSQGIPFQFVIGNNNDEFVKVMPGATMTLTRNNDTTRTLYLNGLTFHAKTDANNTGVNQTQTTPTGQQLALIPNQGTTTTGRYPSLDDLQVKIRAAGTDLGNGFAPASAWMGRQDGRPLVRDGYFIRLDNNQAIDVTIRNDYDYPLLVKVCMSGLQTFNQQV